jgi:serine/threonine protein kinase
MRRAVGAARAQARSAEARARELGSYRLVERLGMGGMGEVWRAEHQLLARQAAIKLMRTETLANPRTAAVVQERFRREAQTLAALRSRHTIELYDYGVTADGSFFFVMELLDGLDLAKLVRGHGPQPAARVIAILHQACQSLAEAHDAGLYHRDIKPANLFLCRAADEVDIVKLLDFGIVHAGDGSDAGQAALAIEVVSLPAPGREPAPGQSGPRLTQGGAVLGTPGYMAPEQASGKALDPRSDLYALGVRGLVAADRAGAVSWAATTSSPCSTTCTSRHRRCGRW